MFFNDIYSKMKMVFIYSYSLIDSYENLTWMFRDNWPIMHPIPTMVIVAMWNCQGAVMVIIQDRRDAIALCCFFPSGKSTSWGIRRFFVGGISGGSFANPRMLSMGISSNHVDDFRMISQFPATNSCYFSMKDGISHGNILGSTMVFRWWHDGYHGLSWNWKIWFCPNLGSQIWEF